MATGGIDVSLPDEYNNLPLGSLNVGSRRKLSKFLDLEGNRVNINNAGIECDVVNDYSGLAELAAFSYQDIMNLKRQRSPVTELLEQWNARNGTVGKLWTYLRMMERYDVLSECRRSIVQDCAIYIENENLRMDAERWRIDQDPTVSTSEIVAEMDIDETKFATVGDVSTGRKTYYDAFICYSDEDENDRKFVRKLIDKLEKNRNLKLFVPGRDDLPGTAGRTFTTYLIEERCRRVVILMSRQFCRSAACAFQVKFARALSPGARSKKLIPIILEKNPSMPRILRLLAVCDFTKEDMSEWVWDHLYAAIIAPVGPVTHFNEEGSDPIEKSNEKLEDITFRYSRRLDEHVDDTTLNEPSSSGSEDMNPKGSRQPVECDVSSGLWGQPSSSRPTEQQIATEYTSLPAYCSMKSPKKGTGCSIFKMLSRKQPKDKGNKKKN